MTHFYHKLHKIDFDNFNKICSYLFNYHDAKHTRVKIKIRNKINKNNKRIYNYDILTYMKIQARS